MTEILFIFKKLIAKLLLPPTSSLLLSIAGLLALKHKPRIGKTLIAVGIFSLYILSTGTGARLLLSRLEIYPPFDIQKASNAQAIVILGAGIYLNAPEYGTDTVNGLALERLRYGAYLAHRTHLPTLVTGGTVWQGRAEASAMAEALEQEFQTPVKWKEDKARDTQDNALFSAIQLRRAGIQRIVLVTHAYHMRRAIAEFKHAGLTPIAAPTVWGKHGKWDPKDLIPSANAAHWCYFAAHEWLGILAQQFRIRNS